MAPLPPNSTARWKYTYQNAIASHSVSFRLLDGSTTADADAIMSAMMTFFDDHVAESTVTSLEFADVGSDIFNLVGDSTLVGETFGATVANLTNNAVGATFIGRGFDGRRARMTIFGWKDAQSEYRVTTAEDTDLIPLIALLNNVATPNISISGGALVFKPYIDIKPNDHWVNDAR